MSSTRTIALVFFAGGLSLSACDKLNFGKKPDPNITGAVNGVAAATGDILYGTATLELANASAADVTVKRYRIFWNGGSHKVSGDFRVPHNGQITLSERIDPKDGDITNLLGGTAGPRVEIIETAP